MRVRVGILPCPQKVNKISKYPSKEFKTAFKTFDTVESIGCGSSPALCAGPLPNEFTPAVVHFRNIRIIIELFHDGKILPRQTRTFLNFLFAQCGHRHFV
jgi:hypothetical protein